MEYQFETRDSFRLIGIQVRTNIKQEGEDIKQLWEQFMGDNVLQKIPNKVSERVYSCYTDYESKLQGKYTVFLGCRVGPNSELPESLSLLEIPGSTYAVYEAKGPIPDIVQETWANIREEKTYRRSFKTDFDVYDLKNDPGNSQVEICVGLVG
jgi:predicted transcriptional regulator YdeE